LVYKSKHLGFVVVVLVHRLDALHIGKTTALKHSRMTLLLTAGTMLP